MQLAVNAFIPKVLGGAGGHTLYIGKPQSRLQKHTFPNTTCINQSPKQQLAIIAWETLLNSPLLCSLAVVACQTSLTSLSLTSHPYTPCNVVHMDLMELGSGAFGCRY
jgi:hypothetical protein